MRLAFTVLSYLGLVGWAVLPWALVERLRSARAREAFLAAEGARKRQTVRLLEERRRVAAELASLQAVRRR